MSCENVDIPSCRPAAMPSVMYAVVLAAAGSGSGAPADTRAMPGRGSVPRGGFSPDMLAAGLLTHAPGGTRATDVAVGLLRAELARGAGGTLVDAGKLASAADENMELHQLGLLTASRGVPHVCMHRCAVRKQKLYANA